MAAARISRKAATARNTTVARPARAPEPEVRMRDVAHLVGITERAVQRIVADLEVAEYIERSRHGRRNRYEVRTDLPLRHPIERHERVSSLITLVLGKQERSREGRARR